MKLLTKEQFITRSNNIHKNKYDYSLIEYINNSTFLEIICPYHGTFLQRPLHHLRGQGCKKCGFISQLSKQRSNTQQFIQRAVSIHGVRYDYSRVEYINKETKVEIICPEHGIFEQIPNNHIRGSGCKKCIGRFDSRYSSNNIPTYSAYSPQLEPYGIKCRKNVDDENILETKCMYCEKWYIPSLSSVRRKINSIKGISGGEHNLYCSEGCKYSCPTYNQNKYPKGFKPATSREVQPQLRKLVLERDNWTCQKCGNKDYLHCHHIDPVANNPIESADIDNCITYCVECHKEIHQQNGCGYNELNC